MQRGRDRGSDLIGNPSPTLEESARILKFRPPPDGCLYGQRILGHHIGIWRQ